MKGTRRTLIDPSLAKEQVKQTFDKFVVLAGTSCWISSRYVDDSGGLNGHFNAYIWHFVNRVGEHHLIMRMTHYTSIF